MKRSRLPKGKPPSQRAVPVNALFHATHEAGHAVAQIVLGTDVRSVDIRPIAMQGGTSLGRVDCGRPENKKIAGQGADAVRQLLIGIMAGPIAEARINPNRTAVFPDDVSRLPEGHDFHVAYRFAIMAICAHETDDGIHATITGEEQRRKADDIRRLFEEAMAAADALLTEHEDAVRRVATLLMKRKVLSGSEVVAIVNQHRGRPD